MRGTRSKRLREHDVEESEKGERMLPSSVSVRVCRLVASPAKKIRLESTNADRAKIDASSVDKTVFDIIPVKKIRLDNAPVKRTQLNSVSGEKIATSVDEKTRLHKTSVKLSSNTPDVSLGDSSYDDDDWKWGKDDNSESDSDEENGNQSKKATDLKSGRQAGNIHVSVNLDKPGNKPPLKHTKHEEDKYAPPSEPSKSGVTPAVRTSTCQPGAEINVAEKEVTTESIKAGYEEREMPTKINNDDGSTKAATSNVVRKLASTNVTSLFNKLHPSVNISLARPDDYNSKHGTTTSKQVTVKDAREVQIVPVQLGVEEHSGNLEAGWRTPDQKLLPRLGAGISVTMVTPGVGTDIGKGGAGKTAREEPIKAQDVGVAVIDLTDNEENEEAIEVEDYLPVVKNERQGKDENDDNNGLKGEGLGVGLVKSEVKKSVIQMGGLGAPGERGSLGVRKQLVFNEGRGWNARDGGESVPRHPVFNQYSLAGRGNIMPGVRTLQPGVRSPTPRGRSAVGVRLPFGGRVLRGSSAPRYGLAGQSPQVAPPSPSVARQRGRVSAGWVWQDARGRVAAQPPRFTSPSPASQMCMGRGTVRTAEQGGRLNISNPSVDIRLEIPGDGGSSEVKLVLSKSQVEAIKKHC